MTIGDRIKSLRESRGLTLEDVGNYLDVNKATVQRYESGSIDIKRNVAIKLAEILRTSPSYIMGWADLPFDSIPTDSSSLAQMGEKNMAIGDNIKYSWSRPIAEAYASAPRTRQEVVCDVLKIDYVVPPTIRESPSASQPPQKDPVFSSAAYDGEGVKGESSTVEKEARELEILKEKGLKPKGSK